MYKKNIFVKHSTVFDDMKQTFDIFLLILNYSGS